MPRTYSLSEGLTSVSKDRSSNVPKGTPVHEVKTNHNGHGGADEDHDGANESLSSNQRAKVMEFYH